jgi:hypothetical protein
MVSEFQSLILNKTWVLVKRPSNRKIIKSRWVYDLKTDVFGNAIRFKARNTAKGFTQVEGVDYTDTFAPVSDYSTVRLILILVQLEAYHCHLIDITTAFLNADLETEIYMEQPEGFTNGTDDVCLLKKALYGLKQAAHNWNQELHNFVQSLGFIRTASDHCLYTKKTGKEIRILLVWVDDILFISSDIDLLLIDKKSVLTKYSGKDKGSINGNEFISWSISKSEKGMMISQDKYAENVLAQFRPFSTRQSKTPADSHVQLGMNPTKKGNPLPDFPYRSVIGSMYYLTNCTRPDISFAVSAAARQQSSFGQTEVTAVKRIIEYLRYSHSLGLIFTTPADYTKPELSCFVDASFAGPNELSTTGYIIYLNGNPVSWKTQKQTITAKSSAEAEYVAVSAAVSELIYLRQLLMEIGFNQSKTIIIYEDSESCISIASNPVKRSKVKHVHIHHHFIRDYVTMNIIELQHIGTNEQIADLFTKGLPGPIFDKHFRNLKLCGSLEGVC